MKRFIVILAVLAALLSCNPNLTIEVRNSSSYPVKAVISGGKILTLSPGESDEIDRRDTVRSFTADPLRVSMRTAGDDYEFYDTPPITLMIYNTFNVGVTLYHSGSIGDPPDGPISISAMSEVNSYEIYTTTPMLRAVVVSGTNEYPVSVNYVYDAPDTMLVTIH
jgi:hypothetical protein